MMEWSSMGTFVVIAIPVLGAALGTTWWSKPQAYKLWGLLVLTITWLIATVTFSMSETPSTSSLFFMHLVFSAGFFTILAQHPNKETPISICLILLFAGLGIGYLTNEGDTGSIVLCGIFGLLILVLFRHRRQEHETPWFAIGALSLGILALFFSVGASEPLRTLARLIPLIMIWPLLPVQGVFIASVSFLPGTLSAFLAVLLPSLGLHGITNLLPVIPEYVLSLLGMLALASAIYGSLLALGQNSMDRLLAYAHIALGAILWWYVATTQSVASGAVVYLASLSLVISGLLIVSQSIRTRFGPLDLNHTHGLAHSMPQLSTLVVLFITAALGLPFFTLFSSFMEMMLNVPSISMVGMGLILLTWFMASWYFPQVMQHVLFGHPSRKIQNAHDLHVYELFSLIVVLALLVMLGMVPSHWFGTKPPASQIAHLSVERSQEGPWKR